MFDFGLELLSTEQKSSHKFLAAGSSRKQLLL
jgi:hypothetical protein